MWCILLLRSCGRGRREQNPQARQCATHTHTHTSGEDLSSQTHSLTHSRTHSYPYSLTQSHTHSSSPPTMKNCRHQNTTHTHTHTHIHQQHPMKTNLQLSLCGVLAKRAHDSAQLLGGDGAITVLVEQGERLLELGNLLFCQLVRHCVVLCVCDVQVFAWCVKVCESFFFFRENSAPAKPQHTQNRSMPPLFSLSKKLFLFFPPSLCFVDLATQVCVLRIEQRHSHMEVCVVKIENCRVHMTFSMHLVCAAANETAIFSCGLMRR